RSTLFPYTTLFRSIRVLQSGVEKEFCDPIRWRMVLRRVIAVGSPVIVRGLSFCLKLIDAADLWRGVAGHHQMKEHGSGLLLPEGLCCRRFWDKTICQD